MTVEIHYRRRFASWDGPLLCATHSDRRYSATDGDLNYLDRRWNQPGRLPPSVRFEDLPHASEASPHLGSFTVWSLRRLDRPRLLLHARPRNYKPQHVMWHDRRLWVLGTECLDVYDEALKHAGRFSDPWLAGGHTVIPGDDGFLYLSCSASDSVLVVDASALAALRALRLPEEIYGRNFPLRRTDSVVEHFISNDLQLAHLNCASPWRGSVLVSNLGPGSIGRFDPSGSYAELLRGFVGCHGVRVDPRSGEVYFTDSCVGTVVFLDSELRPRWRLATHSSWLHDAHRIGAATVAVTPSDRNTIELVDLESREARARIDGSRFGESTQFLAYTQ